MIYLFQSKIRLNTAYEFTYFITHLCSIFIFDPIIVFETHAQNIMFKVVISSLIAQHRKYLLSVGNNTIIFLVIRLKYDTVNIS